MRAPATSPRSATRCGRPATTRAWARHEPGRFRLRPCHMAGARRGPGAEMSCLNPKTLADYANGKLGANQVERIEKHLGGCAGCRAVRTRVERVSDTLRIIADTAPPSLTSANS